MQPWDYVDSEQVPASDSIVYLESRGAEYVIRVDGRELMSNREHGSEDALADLACDRLAELDDARVLVGGLGMGFTLAAALRRVGANGNVTVAELIPAVVRWNRELVGEASKFPLRDPRAAVYVGDVGDLIKRPAQPWSAVLLDVDNGPDPLTAAYNGWLYSQDGLEAAMAALVPGGLLGIWSAADDALFTERLRTAGFEVEVVEVVEAARHPEYPMHVIWIARKPAA